MAQQPNLFTEEMFESPELMQAIIESYIEANPLLNSYAQGFTQLISSFANNFCQQFQTPMTPNNGHAGENNNCNNENNNINENCNNNDNNNDHTNNNANENQQNEKKETANTCNSNDHANAGKPNLFNIINQLFGGNNKQQCPFFSSLMPFINQMFQGYQVNQNTQSNPPDVEKDHKQDDINESDNLLIQDIIMQTLNPEIFESTNTQAANDDNINDDDNENGESKKDENKDQNQNKVVDIIEMIKVLYQLYLQNKDHPNEFFDHLVSSISNVLDQFFPQFRSLFNIPNSNNVDFNFKMFDPSNLISLILNNPYFQMMLNPSANHEFTQTFTYQKHQEKSHTQEKRAELRRSKFTDQNGIVTWRIRHSIDDKWHEVENEMSSDENTIKSSKETWNNISEDQFNNFKDEWKKLYEMQNNQEK